MLEQMVETAIRIKVRESLKSQDLVASQVNEDLIVAQKMAEFAKVLVDIFCK
jgi:hypothetical protein